MNADVFLDLFRGQEALLEGHFLLSSGLHSRGYLQSALVLQDPCQSERLGQAIADKLRHFEATSVLTPALGGVIIGHETARALGIRCLFVERKEGEFKLRRGFAIEPGERIVIVEDVLTTGGSTRETIKVARAVGAHVVAAASIIDRSVPKADLKDVDVPFFSLARISLHTYTPESCPLCDEGVPLTKPGSR